MIEVGNSAIRLPLSAGDDGIFSAVGRWVELLAKDDFQQAFRLAAHDDGYGWSPSLIDRSLRDTVFPMSPVLENTGSGRLQRRPEVLPQHEVERFEEPSPAGEIGEIRFDLPLDGGWSGLTATVALFEHNGELTLTLNDIHVFRPAPLRLQPRRIALRRGSRKML